MNAFRETLFYPFSTDKFQYIYDSGTNNIIRVSFPLFKYLTSNEKEKSNFGIEQSESMLTELLRAQKELGLLSVKKGEAQLSYMEYEDQELIERILNSQLEQLILEVTQNCNLRCEYCVYSGKYHFRRKHQPISMHRETALRGIKYFLDRASPENPPHIGFYGGEPLLNVPLILDCMKSARKNNPNTQFDITTNGTLLSLDLAELFSKVGVTLRISLDGPEEIHDRYRHFKNGSGSFSIVVKNIRALEKSFPEYYRNNVFFHVTLAPDGDLSRVKAFMESLSVDPSRISYGLIDPFDNDFSSCSLQTGILGQAITEELYHYATTFSVHQGKSIFSTLFEATLGRIANRRITKPHDKGYVAGSCLPGRHRLFLNANGTWFPCEKLDFGFSIGEVERGLDIKLIKNMMRDLKQLLSSHCSFCWAYRLCDACLVTFARGAELSADRLNEYCPLEKQFLGKMLKAYAMIMESNPEQVCPSPFAQRPYKRKDT